MPSAYTLLELLVAMSIAMLMLFLITRIFFDTSAAVSQGMATSRIIAGARTIGESLERDFAAMVGPQDDGILVIINKSYAGIQLLDARSPTGEILGDVRSDQIAFIRRTNDPYRIEPMTPANMSTFANSSATDRARVWYGHTLRTDDDGSGPAGGLGNGVYSTYGNTWILGRQALFLGQGSSSVYANYDNGISNSQWSVAGGYTAPSPSPPSMYVMGMTDVLSLDATAFVNEFDAVAAGVYVFRASLFTFAADRLRTNPLPRGPGFTSQQVAQTHAHFMDGVSDFIVEFAGDYYVGDGGTVAGSDGQIDTYNGDIMWYVHDAFANDPRVPLTFDPSSVSVFPIPIGDGGFNDTVATPTAPHYATGFALADGMMVFRHDDKAESDTATPNRWPSLIRIRYRLNDPKGELQGTDATASDGRPGKSFEVILRVNRP